MGLAVAQHLQAILQPAQEPVGLCQAIAGARIDVPARHQRLQRGQQAALAQRRFAATADQLQRLGQELDLADAARPSLDVVGEVLARDLGGDHRLHRAQAVERAIVEVAAVDEGLQHRQQARSGGKVPGHRARLLPGIALPVAALALEVQLHRIERQRQPAGIAERAQAQVDPMAEAVAGDFIQQPRQLLPQPREVVRGRQCARTVGGAFVLVGIDKVDVGTEIQLAAPQLAQREHDQPLRRAGIVADGPVALPKHGFQRLQRHLQAGIGERRGAGEDLVDRRALDRVAPHQPGGFRLPVPTQQARPVVAVACR